VTEPKESVKADEAAIEKKDTVDHTVEKAQASKAGQVGELEGGEAAGTGRTRVSQFVIQTNLSAAILPEKTVKEPATLVERPKTTESTAPIVAPVSAPEPVPAPEPIPAASTESDAAHTKRPYEKPIFNNEDELKPHKMPKTDEEQLAASAAEDKKTIENLAGAGPASTAAYSAPEPVPVKAEEKKVAETPKPVEAPKVAEQTPEEKIAVETPKSTTQAGKAPASNPDAVAAANAAITSSKKEAATPVAEEPKKPEAALKRGEEPVDKTEQPTEAKADETKTSEPSEATEEKKKKEKGGFLSWLKRKFK
jgi:hypothetical protein